MKFNGIATINAPREEVWAFLTDANTVSLCVPGLENLEIIAPKERFKATAVIGFGSMRVKFVTDVQWLELNAPEFAMMKVHADGSGSAADVAAHMRLIEAENDATTLDWEADVTIVGQIASLSTRLMPGITNMLTGMFFRCVRQNIEQGEEVATPRTDV